MSATKPSVYASPMTLKRMEARKQTMTNMIESVTASIKKVLKKDVKVPEDLTTGVVIIEYINAIAPKTIETYDAAPKNVFAQAENFKLVNNALVKFGFSPADLPEPNDAASGKSNQRVISLLHRLSLRSVTLKPAPEHVVKARADQAKKQQETRQKRKEKKEMTLKLRTLAAMRAARYQRGYKRLRERRIHLHRDAEKRGAFYVPPEPRLAFVMRLRGINGVPPKPKKILQLLRLRQINNAVFVRLNKATKNMLKAVEPYVAIGYPSVRMIRCLLIKRGYCRINKQRIPITSNKLISYKLGKYGVHTVDDLVHQLFTVGKHYTKCNRFLWPFKLQNPRGGYGRVGKLRHFVEGGAMGDRQGMINRFIRRCL